VIDPDLGVNIVDLGFVRRVRVAETGSATITMTLTSAACPLTSVMEVQIRSVLSAMDVDFAVEWEWLPSWRPQDISEDGREQLRAIGFSAF
jgi:metal-sulfur cluster biosynthetic enzyme